MKNLILVSLCLFSVISVSAQNQENKIILSLVGTLTKPLKASKVYLAYQVDGQKYLDSATITGQQFKFNFPDVQFAFATLVLDHDGKGFKYLMKKPVDQVDALKFYLHWGGIALKLNDSISTAIFTKSTTNQDYTQLKTLLNIKAEHKLYVLSARMQKTHSPEAEKTYVKYYDSLMEARRPILKKYAIEHPHSAIALVALQEYAGGFPDVNELKPIFYGIDPGIRNIMMGQKFQMILDNKAVVGKPAPGFTQNNTAGKPVSLASFRGKFLLLDFWASWCGPCRAENPRLVKAYNSLKGKNFTILSISADYKETKASWLKAIKTDNLNWTHLSDLKHMDNSVLLLYGIRAIPQNVLINPAGVVVAKDVEPEMLSELIAKEKGNK